MISSIPSAKKHSIWKHTLKASKYMLQARDLYFPKLILHFHSKYFCAVEKEWPKENEHLLCRQQTQM